MYLIVGLGNPGRQYEATRHNMGFDVIDKLVEEYNVPQSGVKFNAMYGKGRIEGQPVILMKPLSYMNLSGGPVRDMANYFKIDPETEMIVIYDDIDLEPGQLRIRKKGSAGGRGEPYAAGAGRAGHAQPLLQPQPLCGGPRQSAV